MTIIERTYDFDLVTFDAYRDIHKGIRGELFSVTLTAGSVDPTDRCGRVALADHVRSVREVLELHAGHEDTVLDPVLVEHLPDLAEKIANDHHELDARFAWLVELAQDAAAADAPLDQRRLGHLLNLELSGFTSAYLAHQIVEERVVMPALEKAVGVEAVIGMHMAILSAIPPDVMGASLAFMLPAMNADDRGELLGGMREGAPLKRSPVSSAWLVRSSIPPSSPPPPSASTLTDPATRGSAMSDCLSEWRHRR